MNRTTISGVNNKHMQHTKKRTSAQADDDTLPLPPEVARPNLYLLGFMATGKSTLGPRLARKLGYRFIDSDSAIEKSQNMKVRDIFEKFGEARFRELERQFISEGHPSSGCVVSCGGGLCCFEGMPELVRSKGISVVLFSKESEILKRASANPSRPLLNCPNPAEKISELLKKRTPFYMRSGIAIATSQSISMTQEHILRIYAAEKRILARNYKNAHRKNRA